MKHTTYNRPAEGLARRNDGNRWLTVAVVAIVMLVPFLGLTEFNSKGEPREAVVALSMLNEGNWILPINNGGDMPYKPPFFHWLIALFSLPTGHVSEFTSRLPSALALIAMTLGVYAFFRRRNGEPTAFVTAMLLLTSFEVHRAGTNCRVDMLLTAFIVGALLLLYEWHERGCRRLPWGAILCMSGAVATKGPVGMLLPCLVTGVYMLVRRERFWPTLLRMAATGLLACVLPALWYVAAWHEGGHDFLQLVYEENFGRFTGTMTYDSHAHPFTYNFTSLIAGWLPWTLLAIFGAFVAPWKTVWSRMRGFMQADATTQFTWLSAVIVFVFYCIPKSKRSVYLLPVYPFMAELLAAWLLHLVRNRPRPVTAYGMVVATLDIVLTFVLFAVGSGLIPHSVFGGRHAADNAAMMTQLGGFFGCWWQLVIALLPMAAGFAMWRFLLQRRSRWYEVHMVHYLVICVAALWIALDGVILPRVQSVKSDRPLAETLSAHYAGQPVYSYLSTDMLHFFCADFYAGDCIRPFVPSRRNGHEATSGTVLKGMPQRGVLMISGNDRKEFFERYGSGYTFRLDRKSDRKSCDTRDTVYFYTFTRELTNKE